MTNGLFDASTFHASLTNKLNIRRITFDVSAHFEELVKRNRLDEFKRNINFIQTISNNVNIKAIAIPDASIQYIHNLTGNLLPLKIQWVPFLGNYKGKLYPESLTKEEIDKYNLDTSLQIINRIHNPTGETPCSALNTTLTIKKNHVHPCIQYDDLAIKLENFNLRHEFFNCDIEWCLHPTSNIINGLT